VCADHPLQQGRAGSGAPTRKDHVLTLFEVIPIRQNALLILRLISVGCGQ